MTHPFPNPYPERYFNKNEFACNAATPDEKNNTDISKNCYYYAQYNNLNRNEGLFRDSENLYTRGWFQCINLIVGVVILGIQIYRETQKSSTSKTIVDKNSLKPQKNNGT